jgi:hypothetical protein
MVEIGKEKKGVGTRNCCGFPIHLGETGRDVKVGTEG